MTLGIIVSSRKKLRWVYSRNLPDFSKSYSRHVGQRLSSMIVLGIGHDHRS